MSKLIKSTQHEPRGIEDAVERFMAEAKASGEMAPEVRALSFRRKGLKLKVELSDDTFLILHLSQSTIH